jgi:hypothetical protein
VNRIVSTIARSREERRRRKWAERIAGWYDRFGFCRAVALKAIDSGNGESIELPLDATGDGLTTSEQSRSGRETELALIYPLIH